MKKYIVRTAELLGFAIIILAGLVIAGRILMPKWSGADDNHIGAIVRGFYAEEDSSIQVMFMGNSDCYRGITPIELYEKSGISAYSYTSPGQRMWTAYYILEDTLRTQKPSVIFLNVDAAFYNKPSTDGNTHKGLDYMELSTVKLSAINDDIYNNSFTKQAEYVFPFLKYHGRATSLTSADFTEAFGDFHEADKGLDICFDSVAWNDGYSYMVENDKYKDFAENAKPYLDDFVELCQQNDITLVLMELPSADSWNLTKSKTAQAYADANGLEFIDFNLIGDEIGLNWTTDTADGGDHLNVYGAQKCTEYINDFINRHNYDLKDYRNDAEADQFNKDLAEYKKQLEEKSAD